MIDVAKARADTRACQSVVHFNNAGSSLMPVPVSDALHAYLKAEEFKGGYETATSESAALANFYRASATLLNCAPEEIAYVENATRAWDMAFYSLAFKPGDKILTTLSEYPSNIIGYLQQAKRFGAEVVYVPNDEHGQLDTQALANLIDKHVKLISINHVPTGGGLVNPVAEVGRLAKAAGVPFLLDACQSLGQIPVDIAAIGCDMLSGTGRKYLRGPRGTGLLYVRAGFAEELEPPFLDNHAAQLTSASEYRVHPHARRFETFEQYFAGKAALGVAIDYACSWGIANIQTRVYSLAARLRDTLAELDGVSVADEGKEKCGLVTFTAHQRSASQVQAALATKNINVSVSSHVWNLVHYEQKGLDETVRASVHYFNTEEEVDLFGANLKEILNTVAT